MWMPSAWREESKGRNIKKPLTLRIRQAAKSGEVRGPRKRGKKGGFLLRKSGISCAREAIRGHNLHQSEERVKD